MRPKPPADLTISLSDTLTRRKSFIELVESRRNFNKLEERSGWFVRPKAPAEVAISLLNTLTQTRSFNEVEKKKKHH